MQHGFGNLVGEWVVLRQLQMAQAENFIRSATAPEIRAGVMAANVARKMNTAGSRVAKSRLRMNALSRLPANRLLPLKASE